MSKQRVKVTARVLGGYVVAVIAVATAAFMMNFGFGFINKIVRIAELALYIALLTVLPFLLCAIMGEIFAIRIWSYYCGFSLGLGFVGMWLSDKLPFEGFGIIMAFGLAAILLALCVILLENFNIRRQVYHVLFVVLTACSFWPELEIFRLIGTSFVFVCTLVGGLVYWAVSGRFAGSDARFNTRAGA
jgi:hypothetical protein